MIQVVLLPHRLVVIKATISQAQTISSWSMKKMINQPKTEISFAGVPCNDGGCGLSE